MADENTGSSTLVLDIQFDDGSVRQGWIRLSNDSQKAAKKVGDDFKKIKLVDFDQVKEEGESALASLSGSFLQFGLAVGIATASLKTLKEGFDLALEGEKIAAINAQFETLTKQAGIAGDALKRGLEKAADGLIDGDELLQTANSAIINLGANAARLPQVLELARKATVALGGNLEERFAGIVTAIESGNARALKSQGIIIDSEKAMRDYANSLGLTAGELNKSQQQQAILNAVLEQGGEKFKNIDGSIQPLTDNVQRLKVAFKELGDEVATSVSNSGFFQGVAKNLVDFAKSDGLKHAVHEFADNFGNTLTESVLTGNPFVGLFNAFTQSAIVGIKQTNLTAKEEIEKFKNEVANAGSTKSNPGTPAVLDPQQVAAIKLRGLEVENALKQQALSQNAIEASQTDFLLSEYQKRQVLAQSYAQRILLVQDQANIERQILQQQRAANQIQTEADYQTKLLELNTRTTETIRKLEQDKAKANDEYTATLAENASASQVAMSALSEALTGASIAATDFAHTAAKNFRDIGKTMFTSIGNAAGQAFAAFGKAVATGQNALEAFLNSLLQSFGQMAIQLGTQFMLQGAAYIWAGLPNGAALVSAGAALAAFGGLLAGLGGGKSASTGGGSDTGGGVSSNPTDTTTEVTAPKDLERKKPDTYVSFVVDGNYYETQDSAMKLANLVSDYFDKNGIVIRGVA